MRRIRLLPSSFLSMALLVGCAVNPKALKLQIRFAVQRGDAKAVEANLNRLPVASQQRAAEDALFSAAYYGKASVVEMLLGHRIDVNAPPARSTVRWHALHAACAHGHLDVARLLVQAGANVDARDAKGRTALSLAAENGHLNVAKFLAKRGAAQGIGDNNGKTALMYAAEKGNWLLAGSLVKNAQELQPYLDRRFKRHMDFTRPGLNIARRQVEEARISVDESQAMLGLGVSLGKRNEATLLMISVQELLKKTLTLDDVYKGRDPSGISKEKRAEHLGIVKALLARGADPNLLHVKGLRHGGRGARQVSQDRTGVVIQSSFSRGSSGTIVDSSSEYGLSALQLAEKYNDSELAGLLRAAGALPHK